MKAQKIFTSLFISLLTISAPAMAEDCGTITVDCGAARIDIPGLPKHSKLCGDADRIDCGLPTHNSPEGEPGRIGGKHAGVIVPNGVRIEGINSMGDSGGGRVFHTRNVWNDNSCPKHQTWGRGCIVVSPEAIRRLRECKGSKLVIKNAKGGTVSRGYASKDRKELLNQRNKKAEEVPSRSKSVHVSESAAGSSGSF